jgi:hypothetical protein
VVDIVARPVSVAQSIYIYLLFSMNTFPGTPFELQQLILPRKASGYAVQWLGTDRILDRNSTKFSPIREAGISNIFSHFSEATKAGQQWLSTHPETPIAIVPVTFDDLFERWVLILGVIQPETPRIDFT